MHLSVSAAAVVQNSLENISILDTGKNPTLSNLIIFIFSNFYHKKFARTRKETSLLSQLNLGKIFNQPDKPNLMNSVNLHFIIIRLKLVIKTVTFEIN